MLMTYQTIVDVGGNHGALLQVRLRLQTDSSWSDSMQLLLAKAPQSEGIVLDLPGVVATAPSLVLLLLFFSLSLSLCSSPSRNTRVCACCICVCV
jgi:hypothetical protein